MKRTLLIFTLATLTLGGVLDSCKKDDPDNPDPQGGKTFEEIVKNLPGVYLSADYYDEAGYGLVVWLKEDGTMERYCFFDDDVKDGVNIDNSYSAKGTWRAFKVEDIPSKTAICSEVMYDSSPEVEIDTSFLYYYNDKTYVCSNIWGVDEFFKVSQTFEEFKKGLESFLPGHLKETELTKGEVAGEVTESSPNPPDDFKCWMRNLPDDVCLKDLSIPGSHDAFSYRCIVDAEDQTLDAEEQFNWGVRWFDVRYYWSNFAGGNVYPCHGSFGSPNKLYGLKTELERLEKCVKNNPSEGVIIRLRDESDMDQTSEDDKNREKWIKEFLRDHSNLYIPVTYSMQLSDIRGKIAVMSDSGDLSDTPYYFDFKYEQDEYYYNDKDKQGNVRSDLSYIDKKTNAFKKLIDEHRKELKYCNDGDNDWTVNHCSGYLPTFRPVEFAYRVTPELAEVLFNASHAEECKTYGVVPMDFIGRGKVFESALCIIKEGIDAYQYPIHTIDITGLLVESSKRLNGLPEYEPMQPEIVNYIDVPFTVGINDNGTPRVVNFACGNLYYEEHPQFNGFYFFWEPTGGYSPTFPPGKFDFLSLFTWGYGEWSSKPSDDRYQEYAFTDWGEDLYPKEGGYRTLSAEEWDYLLNKRVVPGYDRTRAWVRVDDVPGLLILGDNYKGINSIYNGSYLHSDDWPGDCVFLPGIGEYKNGKLVNVKSCYYWTSTPSSEDAECAKALVFLEYGSAKPYFEDLPRKTRLPVRLVRRQ